MYSTLALPQMSARAARLLRKPAREQGRDRHVEHYALAHARAFAKTENTTELGQAGC